MAALSGFWSLSLTPNMGYMCINEPVSGVEFPFPHGEVLVSTTDLKGRILYGNEAFVRISGYSKDELVGQPHNLIRHPDVPAEAFRDLWDTIARGVSWTGVVKNRRKNGDHYWVQANVTPLLDGNQVVGYLSVRTEPARATIDAVEALYATMRAEAARGRLVHVVSEGRVVRSDLTGRLARLLRPGPFGWLALVTGGLSSVSMAVGMAIAGKPVPDSL